MQFLAALTITLLATAASASPATVGLTKRNPNGFSLKGSSDADRARATLLKSNLTTAPAINLKYNLYTTSLGVGDPPTSYNLIVDTGSSNTFCGTDRPYVQTCTSISTGEAVSVRYGSGNWSGQEYLDQVTLTSDLVITNQSIGDAQQSFGFPSGVDGILGLGPVGLTLQTLSSDMNATIPTIMNNLMSQNLITEQVLGVSFAPSTNDNDTDGALTYGGVDSSLYEGEVTYTPVTETPPASSYWGINITSCTYGDDTIISASTAGIVDTGTTMILLANDLFAKYMDAVQGATYNSTLGAIQIPKDSVSAMKPLNFSIGDQVFTLDVAAQLFPTREDLIWGGVADNRYSVIANMSYFSGGGLDFVLGIKFLERYYAVFDTDAQRVGFAQTNNTFTVDQG